MTTREHPEHVIVDGVKGRGTIRRNLPGLVGLLPRLVG